jgi:hypothetical protein
MVDNMLKFNPGSAWDKILKRIISEPLPVFAIAHSEDEKAKKMPPRVIRLRAPKLKGYSGEKIRQMRAAHGVGRPVRIAA